MLQLYGCQFLPMAVVALIRKGQFDFFYAALQMALLPRLLAPGMLAVASTGGIFLTTALGQCYFRKSLWPFSSVFIKIY